MEVVVLLPFGWFCRLVPFGQAVNVCPSAEASPAVVRYRHAAWACPHGKLGLGDSPCSVCLLFCLGLLFYLDARGVRCSLHLTEQIPSGHNGLVQHLAAAWDQAPSCVLRESCWDGNAAPALWKCPMRECWRLWLSCLVQLRGKSIFWGLNILDESQLAA